MSPSNPRLLIIAVLCLGAPSYAVAGDEDNRPPPTLTLDFQPLPGARLFAACGVGGLPIGAGAKGNQMCDDNQGGPGDGKEIRNHVGYIPGQSLYLQETDGNIWHQVLLEPKDNFSMEVFINTSSGTAGLSNAREMSGGKNEGHYQPLCCVEKSGTGTGDPTRVLFRMKIDQAGMVQDMIKDKFDRKPTIIQTTTGQQMSSRFEMDMRNSTYYDINTPAKIVNTLALTLPTISPQDAQFFDPANLQFDMAQDVDKSFITGGRFKIVSWGDDTKDPRYAYIGGQFDHLNQPWLEFWHGSKYWQPGDPYPDPTGRWQDDGSDDGESCKQFGSC